MTAFTIAQTDGVAVVTFDLAGEPVNKLTRAVRTEFEELLARLRADETVRAVVFRSGKPDSFIAGADIEEFRRLQAQADRGDRSRADGQEMLQRVADFPKPVVAAIHGACLGGGLELALACHYRIATDHPKTLARPPRGAAGPAARAPAAASGCRGSSASGPRSTSSWPGRA